MMKMFRTLREESELLMKLKGHNPDNKLAPGALKEGHEGLESQLDNFKDARKWDMEFERRPF